MARFKKPGWTQFPNEIFDQLMPVLSGAQFKVICLIARQTAGWHRDRDRMSLATIVERTGLSKQGVVDSIRYLEEREFIVKGGGALRSKTEKPEACWYELNVEDVDLTVNSLDCSENLTVNSLDCSNSTTVNSLDYSTVNSLDCPIRSKEKYKEKTEEKESNPPSFSDQKLQNPPEPLEQETQNLKTIPPPAALHAEKYSETQSTLHDLQLDEPTDKFIANAYRQSRGAKVSKTEIKRWAEKIATTEDSLSREEFRTQIWHFLDTPSKWLRENKWPLAAFLKDPSSYTAPIPAYQASQDAPVDSVRAYRSSEASGNAPVGFYSAKNNTPVYLQYVDKWNTLIPEVTCGELLAFQIEQANTTISDPQFRQAWPVILEKCRLIADNQPERLKPLSWILDPNFKGSNWKSLVNGSLDYATRPRASGAGMSASDQALEAAIRAEQEAERGKS